MNFSRVSAVTVVALAGLLLAGCSVAGAPTPNPTSAPSPQPSGIGQAFVSVGDCFDQPNPSEAPTIVDCATPHETEAYESLTVKGRSFPGDDTIKAQAVTACESSFSTFVGIDYADTKLAMSFFYPTARSWAAGDRQIICLISNPAGTTTGSLAGVGQ